MTFRDYRWEKRRHACPKCGFVSLREGVVRAGNFVPSHCTLCKREIAARTKIMDARIVLADVAAKRRARKVRLANRKRKT